MHIETTAKNGITSVETDFDYEQLQKLFESNGVVAKISHNAGTSYCNSLYFNGLSYIQKNKLKTKMVFVHIPYLKNIYNKELFFADFIEVISKTGDENEYRKIL